MLGRESRLWPKPALSCAPSFATMWAVGEGFEDHDGPLEPEALLPAPDRLWRHPAERGAEQAAANLAARRAQGRRWPAMVMSFLAGCCVVGLAWMLTDRNQTPITEAVSQEIIVGETSFEGTLSLVDWVDDVSQLNRNSVVALHLGGDAPQEHVQAVLLRDDGHLITSYHAIAGAEDITAELPSGPLPAQVVGADSVSGVAVLKINSPNLPRPTFGDPSLVRVRDQLVALSYPSASPEPAQAVDVVAEEYVATLPSGDILSGLFRLSDNLTNEWSGSAILSEDGGIVGLAVTGRDGNPYAIPIDAARSAANQLISDGTVEHKAYLGVDMAGVTEGLQAERGLSGGVLLTRVWSETAAARAGLVAGDVITQAGPVNVLSRTDLREALATLEPGDSIEITFSRGVAATGAADTARDPGSLDTELITATVIVGATPA